MTRVILVRHGESTYNVERRVQGHCDQSDLTEKGQAGARQVGAALQGIKFDAVYSSPLKRAKQTAQLILSSLSDQGTAVPDLRLTDNLKEINLLQWEGLTFDEVEQQYPEGFLLWRDRPLELKMPMETPEGIVDFYPVPALYEQAQQFWQDILPQHLGETILVVAHSAINRCLIGAAVGQGAGSYKAMHQSNCGISVLNFAGGLGDPVQLESVNLTAHLGEPIPKPRKGTKGARFLLVRHGETNWNRDKRFQGQIDVPLNDQGRVQAGQAAEFLKDVTIDRAVSSPMLRPKETAEIILKYHPDITLELDDRLCEISHGLWEGKLEAEIEAEFPGELKQWQIAPETVQMPEGENLQQVWDRVVLAWQDLVASTPESQGDRPTTVLVVAHDAVNKAILGYLIDRGPETFWVFKQGNGAVTVIDYPQGNQGKPLIHALNITSHLGGVLDKTAAGAL
ncbi:histidine phosphatase family protein [Leptolyngbya ohadii]|uniref:histidine phosphatase family protein n=1 Tax=Leptolyngbya ohadii TaxID=1962290 RepID=UPI000B5A06F4